MNITSARGSSIGTYKDCEFKYWLIYECDIEDKSGFKAVLGSIIHNVMELLAESKRVGHFKLDSKINDYKYLLGLVYKKFKSEYLEHPWDYETDIKFCSKQIEYLLESPFAPNKCNILDIERQFELTLNKIGFKLPNGDYLKLRGTIDRIDIVDDETIHIIDYKSGKRLNWDSGTVKELSDFEKDLQFRIYNLAASIIYPQYKHRIFTVIYPQDGGPYTFSLDDSDKTATLDILRRYFNKIYLNSNPHRLIDDGNRRREHFKCKYVCSFGKDGSCNKYYDILKKEKYNKTKEILQQISISAKAGKKASPRNDYSGPKIFKANLIERSNDSTV